MAKPRMRVLTLGLATGALATLGPGVGAGHAAGPITGSSSSTSGGVFWTVLSLLALASVAILAFIVYSRHRERTSAAAGAPPDGLGLKDLEAQAAQVLVETDDAVMTSDQELGFAVAQFGQESAARFATTLEAAKKDLAEAFRLRARLDADPALDEAERYQILQQAVEMCTQANAALDTQTASFEQLRDLPRRTPEVLDQLDAQLAGAPQQINAAIAALDQAGALYPPAALEPVAQNPQQARQLVDYAADAVAEARRQLAADQGGQAAVATGSAQEALGQVGLLTRGGRPQTRRPGTGQGRGGRRHRRGGRPARAGPRPAGGRGSGGRAAADRARPGGRPDQGRGAGRARRPARPARPAPGRGRAARRTAARPAERAERRAGAQAMLEQATLAARSDVAAAEDFITTRRGAIGSQARTLQAEASRQLSKSLSLAAADPTAALAAARQASGYARAAQQQANSDLRGFGDGLGRAAGSRAAAGGALGGMLGGLAAQSTSGGEARRPARRADRAPARRLPRRARRLRRAPRHRRPLLTTPSRVPSPTRRSNPMCNKQSIFGRVTQMARANVNAVIDSAEDPGRMLDQLVRDYTESISEAEQAVAQTVGDLRMMEEDLEQDRKAAAEWGGKALAASRKADDLRASGDTGGADTFDGLAKVAVGRQLDAEREVADGTVQLAIRTEVTVKLKAGLGEMRDKLVDLKKRRDNLVARTKTGQARSRMQDAVRSLDILDPTGEVPRFEEKVRREEARVKGQAELAASTLDAQFNSLDSLAEDFEVDARLAALKAGGADGAVAASAPVIPVF
jgi:phage shock protein A